MFSKILIANRGEIALRIIRACKELGIQTVAIYSETDANSLHVKFADEAICIGPAEAYKSYLNIPSIISAAEITDAEAIHPGYGFLSENHRFVEICETCKIKFIGPSLESIKQMGDKARARQIMEAAGIPVIPGSGKAVETDVEAFEIANQIGFPVIIKAAGGGGGRGMRVVHTEASFLNAFMTAQAEAISSFDNPKLYIEKLIERPRHIEFQVLGDHYGNIVHLGERECSIQRRYQKLIEESPSVCLTPRLRGKMGEAAINAAKAVNYYSSGTIEFLLDKNDNFYFMEMNTRIQVEHPVTEMVTGVDLIKEQIKVAAGEKLSFSQEDIKIRGHAIECRINAENPRSFIPCPGTITSFHLPGGPGIRVDTAAYLNCKISSYYDSLIAKLIAYGNSRQEAICRMQRALEEFIIEGIETTIPFHIEMMKNKDFIDGNIDTDFLRRLNVN
ncbi:MAG: acetyl-CoA carboxylase biotin carboxylase subunit [bacterium]|nr:acetyl-CoA carboxylase biotin carboxylase subunit [bacterium]